MHTPLFEVLCGSVYHTHFMTMTSLHPCGGSVASVNATEHYILKGELVFSLMFLQIYIEYEQEIKIYFRHRSHT